MPPHSAALPRLRYVLGEYHPRRRTTMDYFSAHPFTSLVLGFGAVTLTAAWFLLDIHRKWARTFGRKALTREDVLADALERLAAAESTIAALEERVRPLEAIGKIAVQKVGFLRFNPFEHTGGDQSFALCLLDRESNGVIVSSLYTRDGVRVYAKEIDGGKPKHPLSDEERHVLTQALNGKL